jgi:hypothetical protein
MNTIGLNKEDWDKHFKLMEDLDMAGVTVNPIGYWTQADENDDIPFAGVFDGNRKSLINLRCTWPGRADGWNPMSTGLFLYLSGNNGLIRDLTLIEPDIDGGAWCGSLVGYFNEGIVRECYVIGGDVSGLSIHTGGLIGLARNRAYIKACSSSANVKGKRYVGGLIGYCIHGTVVSNCSATGDVYGESAIGGLIGNCGDQCIITGSFATGDVHGSNRVDGSRVGGLVGETYGGRIICCYATGNVSGSDDLVGGLVGFPANGPYIRDSYSIGQVNGTGEDIGGLTGKNWGDVYDCFWDSETSGISTGGSGTGITTLQMQDPNTFITVGWDFVGESVNGPSDIWLMPDGGGYPILWWQVSSLPPLPSFSGGTGEPNDPFVISTAEELNSIGGNPRLMETHFRLANDIDLKGINFFLIGSDGYPFRGIFDGNGCAIRNFSYEESRDKYREYVGLFRYVRGMKAEIRDLTLTNSSIVNEVPTWYSEDVGPVGSLVGMFRDGTMVNCHVENSSLSVSCSAGGLIGSNVYGMITGCTSDATVRGNDDGMGGLLGGNHEGIVSDCHASGDILGGYSSYVLGGLTGTNDNGLIEFCTASGNVSSGGHSIGGLAGNNWGILSNCAAFGSVSGGREVGGLVGGWNVGWIFESCSYSDVVGTESVGGLVGENIGIISNSYARGKVSGNKSVGGLVGNNTYYPNVFGEIETSYSTGFVSGIANISGLVYRGHTKATTSDNCFWDIQTSGQTTSDGGTGKTTVEMKTADTFLEAGWDFVDETVNGTEDIWWILEGQDYPRLWWESRDN